MDEEAKKAAERVEQRVKAKIAEISTRVLDHFSMERMGTDLVIRCQFPERESR